MLGNDCVSFKVMLVEDDEGFRLILAGFLLARFPANVLYVAADGAEAMKKFKDFLPQLIFMMLNCRGRMGLK
jgi:CheY-like chemotaxis protein